MSRSDFWPLGQGELMTDEHHQSDGSPAQPDNGADEQATTRTTRASKAKGPKATKAPATRRPIKLSLPVESIAKLQLHAIQEGISVSALVAKLAREHCNEWTIHRTPTRS